MDTFAGQRTKNELSRNALWYAIALVPLLVCPAHSWTCTFRVLVAQEDNTFSDAGMVCAPESAEEQASSLNVTVDSVLDKFRSSFAPPLYCMLAYSPFHRTVHACFGHCMLRTVRTYACYRYRSTPRHAYMALVYGAVVLPSILPRFRSLVRPAS